MSFVTAASGAGSDRQGLAGILKSQYHAALAMLRETIERCPEDLWFSTDHLNSYWQIAYHALFFTDLYLQPNETTFHGWEGHQADVQNPDGIPGPPDPASSLPLIPSPYSKEEVLTYWSICEEMVDGAVDALDLQSPDSGFRRYQISKLEHQFVNIRHIQHHTAQLADRLRSAAGVGTKWVGAVHRRS